MKSFLVLVAGLLIGVGLFRLGSEIAAFQTVDQVAAGWRNGDGMGAAARAQDMRYAVASGDPRQMERMTQDQLKSAPFDPVLLSLLAVARMSGKMPDLVTGAGLLDQAVAIAPRDRRVREIRKAMQDGLQGPPPTLPPLAE